MIEIAMCYIMNMSILKKIGDMNAAIGRGVIGAIEAVNPLDAESRGNRLINQTAKKYQTTPEFKTILDKTNPHVGGGFKDSGKLVNSEAAARYLPKAPFSRLNSRMWVSGKADNPESSMLHEGLHAAWDQDSPEARQQYMSVLDRTLPKMEALSFDGNPDARSWLQSKTNGYKGNQDYNTMSTLPPQIQNEVHSYIPEYYQSTKQPMPTDLKSYYSRYYNTQ